MRDPLRTLKFQDDMYKEQQRLRKQVRHGSNGVVCPVNRKMTYDEVVRFVNHQPHWVQSIWDLTGIENRNMTYKSR